LAAPAINELVKTRSEIKLIWRAFELRPEPFPLPDATSDFFTNMWRDSIYPLAEGLDMEIKMPTIKPRSRITHEASKWANSVGKFDEFKEAIFRAYFKRSKNIGEIETLLSIAKKLGLKADSLQNALETNEFLEEVLTDENRAESIGLNVVPAFIADGKSGLTGLQPVENLTKLIQSI